MSVRCLTHRQSLDNCPESCEDDYDREVRRANGEDAHTHDACPVHSGQWFNKSSGDCSCGARHRA